MKSFFVLLKLHIFMLKFFYTENTLENALTFNQSYSSGIRYPRLWLFF